MVIANVLNIYTTVAGLWQYDYGQILRLQGIKLPTAVEIHFSLQEKDGESVTRIGTTKDGVTDVVIPDSMLENDATTMDYKIYPLSARRLRPLRWEMNCVRYLLDIVF